MGLFVPLDVNWVNHPKIIAVGFEGAGLHAAAMCLAKQFETDGVLHVAQLTRIGATPELVDLLVTEGLFDRVDDRRVAVHGWLDRNPAVSDYSAAARAGNHKRWRHPGPVRTCTRCNPELTTTAPDDIGGDSGATRPGVGATEGDTTPEISTDDPATGAEPGDNHTNGETPSSIAMPSPASRPGVRGDSPRSRPRVAETEAQSETETQAETTHSPRSARARPTKPSTPPVDIPPDIDDPDERAAREALAHLTALHRQQEP